MTLALFLLILGLLVLVHEGGHFWVARRFGIRVLEFGIGLPPKLKTLGVRGGTEYSLNWLPLGGFVRLLGEEGREEIEKEERRFAFFAKPAWQRALVLLGGVVGNLLLASVLFAGIYSYLGVPRVDKERVMVVGVAEGSPAREVGISKQDVVLKVGGERVEGVEEFVDKIKKSVGQEVVLKLDRLSAEGELKGEEREVKVVPRVDPPEGQGALGVVVVEMPTLKYEKKRWYLAPIYGIGVGLRESYAWGKGVVMGLGKMGKDLVQGRGVGEEISGPVGVYKMTGEIQKGGWLSIVRFTAVLSVNLAILNLLPLPALDGGRLLFVGLEKVFGKRRIERVEGWVHQVGFLLLLLLLLLVTWKDLGR